MNTPKHVAFIMDGNSTWAAINKKPVMDGYLKGMQTMGQVILESKSIGIKYVTFYAFSSENWCRPKIWIKEFMNLAMWFLKSDRVIKDVLEAGAKFVVIGDSSKLDKDFQKILFDYEEKTKNNIGITVCLAISYGARDEIVRAVRRMESQKIEFTEEAISNNLDTAGMPDPNLIVRTSGKKRLSNFLLWQASYSEFYFCDALWPDFNVSELHRAIDDYSSRRLTTFGK